MLNFQEADSSAPRDPAELLAARLKAICPGREVDLEGLEFKVRVYPAGLNQLRQFSSYTGKVVSVLAKLDSLPKTEEAMKELLPSIIDLFTGEMLALVTACVSPTLPPNMPHWFMPPIIEAWLIESFADESKWRPWKQALERVKEVVPSGKSIPPKD